MTAGRSISTALFNVLHKVEGLPSHDIESISVLISAGEWAIALEVLCTQIYEYDCVLSSQVSDELLRLGRQLEVSVELLLGDPSA